MCAFGVRTDVEREDPFPNKQLRMRHLAEHEQLTREKGMAIGG